MTTINLKIENIDPIIDTPIKITIQLHYHCIKNDTMYDTSMTKLKLNMDIIDINKTYNLDVKPLVIYQILTKIKKRGMNTIYLHNLKDNKEKQEKDINMKIYKTDKGIGLKVNDRYASDYNRYCNIL